MEKAIIDRIEEEKYAVLLVGPEETERIVERDQLPQGAREGDHLLIGEDGQFHLDYASQDQRRDAVHSKLELLRQRKSRYRQK